MSSAPSIYDFADFASFFDARMKHAASESAAWSFRFLSRRLKMRSPSLLNMVAKGKRQATPALLTKICAALDLTEHEASYARALVSLRRAKTASDKAHFTEVLLALRPKGKTLLVELDAFEAVASWHHFVLLEMGHLADFRPDPAWVARALGGAVPVAEIEAAFERLVRFGIFKRTPDGTYERTATDWRTPSNVPSTAIRTFHKQMLARAADAIDEQEVGDRYFTGTALTIDASQLEAAQQLIAEFRQRFVSVFQSRAGDETYHLAVQFFRVSAPKKERA